MIMSIRGKKSKPKEIKKIEEFINNTTNQKTEWTGLKDIMVITADIIIIKEKNIMNWSI